MTEKMAQPEFRLDGKRALVTGAGRGIGFAIAQSLGRGGARIVLNDLDANATREAVERLAATGIEAEPLPFDVADEAQVVEALSSSISAGGPIDIAVNNAGFQHKKNFLEFSSTEWRRVIDVHVNGAFHVTRAVLPGMIDQSFGRLIMIGSVLTQSVKHPTAPYVAAKGAVSALARELAFEFGPSGVTCNIISPGFVATELTRASQDDAEFSRYLAERVPLGRWATPEDIGSAAVYLASGAGAFVNGANILVDGGLLSSI